MTPYEWHPISLRLACSRLKRDWFIADRFSCHVIEVFVRLVDQAYITSLQNKYMYMNHNWTQDRSSLCVSGSSLWESLREKSMVGILSLFNPHNNNVRLCYGMQIDTDCRVATPELLFWSPFLRWISVSLNCDSKTCLDFNQSTTSVTWPANSNSDPPALRTIKIFCRSQHQTQKHLHKFSNTSGIWPIDFWAISTVFCHIFAYFLRLSKMYHNHDLVCQFCTHISDCIPLKAIFKTTNIKCLFCNAELFFYRNNAIKSIGAYYFFACSTSDKHQTSMQHS